MSLKFEVAILIMITLVRPPVLFAQQSEIQGIRLVDVMSIRTEANVEDAPYQFKSIGDLFATDDGTIYVLDSPKNLVYQFSSAGQYLKRFDFGKIQGQPYSSEHIVVDSEGRVYVSNAKRKLIAVADKSGRMMKPISTQIRVADMAIGSDDQLYISGQVAIYGPWGLVTYGGPLLHQLSREGNIVARFNKRRPLGNAGRFAISTEGDIYYSFSYPHIIRKFSPDRMLINEFARVLPPMPKPELGRTRLELKGRAGEERELEVIGGLSIKPGQIFTLPGGFILVLLSWVEGEVAKQGFDLYDKSGRHIVSQSVASAGFPPSVIPSKSFASGLIGFVSPLAVDTQGHMYLSYRVIENEVEKTARGGRTIHQKPVSSTLKKYRIEFLY